MDRIDTLKDLRRRLYEGEDIRPILEDLLWLEIDPGCFKDRTESEQ